MWNKIYLISLAAAVVAIGILLYLSGSWLGSITKPEDVEAHYNFYSNIGWTFALISSLVLLVLGNVVLWTTGKTWAMWSSLAYFVVFVIAQTFWLENSFFRYKQENNLGSGLISWSPLFGVVLVILATIIVFFNQYLVKRMQDKMLPAEAQAVESLPEESPINEDRG